MSDLPDADFVTGIVLDMPFNMDFTAKNPAWLKDVNVKMVLIDLNTKKKVFEINQPLSKHTQTNARIGYTSIFC